MNKFIKIFIPIVIIYIIFIGINITISKYVLTSSYSINIVLKDEENNSNELTKEKNVNENNTIEPLPIEDDIIHLDEEVLICE